MNSKYFYHDKPLLGLDIGSRSIKIMQLQKQDKKFELVGYGICEFDQNATDEGIIINHELIAKVTAKLFESQIVGSINTQRVAVSVPAAKTYTRMIELPIIKDDEIPEAIKTEAEQYIPIPLENLYLDYAIVERRKDNIEVLAVATPKKIIDTRIELCQILGLEPIVFDTNILATARLYERQDKNKDIPTIIVDFGSVSTDITVYDKSVLVTSTIIGGGDVFTDTIARLLKVSTEEAHIIKTKYGMGKSQKQSQVLSGVEPIVKQLGKEIQRMIRYHEERSGSSKNIGQIVTMGGGANMPGLSEYLTNMLRVPVRTSDPFANLSTGKILPPHNLERSIFNTVAGLSIIHPQEILVK